MKTVQCSSSMIASAFRILQTVTPLFAAILAIALTNYCVWVNNYGAGSQLFYADSSIPMFISADGFYYLAQANTWLHGGESVPLLARMAGMAARITGCPLETVCFWLPLTGSLALVPCFLIWRYLLGWPLWSTALAACLFFLMPAWVCRSHIGWFDTDFGIAVGWNYCLAGLALLTRPGNTFSIAGFSIFLGSGLLLSLWWKPGVFLLPVAALLWGGSLLWTYLHERRRKIADAYRRQSVLLSSYVLKKKRSRIQLAVCCAIALGLAVAWTLNTAWIVELRQYAAAHLDLIFHTSRSDIIAASIKELRALPLHESLRLLGGTTATGGFALLALLFFCIRRRALLPAMLPFLGVLALGLYSRRFLYLAALPVALALTDVTLFLGDELRTAARKAISLCVALTFVAAMSWWLISWNPSVYFTRAHDAVVQSLRKAAQRGAHVWNWWDDGYFLRARAGVTPLIDGGSQTGGERAYWAARSFVGGDARFSRRWIRFFALRGEEGLHTLECAWGGSKAAYAALETIFSSNEPSDAAQAHPQLPGGTMEWLFPKGKVFLYIPQRLLRISQVWEPLGRLHSPSPQDMRPCIDSFARENFFYDPISGALALPSAVLERGYTGVTDFLLTDRRPLNAPWPDKGLYLVAHTASPYIYIATPRGLASLPLRLMAPESEGIRGFRPVAIDYGTAGVWEVLPE